MSRWINADALKESWKEIEIDGATLSVIYGLLKSVDEAPSIDIVRCKECKWRNNIGCALMIVDDSDKPKDDDFCSWGERKSDE